MYELRVFHPGEARAREVVRLDKASDVLVKIPAILSEHAECERVEVYASGLRLFAVDCTGQQLPN